MDLNNILSQAQSLAQGHPYLILAILLLIFGAIISNRLVSYLLYFLAFLAILQEFGLIDVFVSFLKAIPGIIEKMKGVIG
ncbi:t26-9p [Pyrococcus kukulkanii]|uniref:t26-9p n=1 Tax=Pyrococcus kukulkanii TaxID=1609559 RepID=UPI003568F052